MRTIKYGCILSSANLDGSSLEVEAFSDPAGNTTTMTVEAGDMVGDLQFDPETSTVSITIYTVVNGDAWIENDVPTISGEFIISTCTDLPYQAGSLGICLDDNKFYSVNLQQTLAIVDAAIAAAIGP